MRASDWDKVAPEYFKYIESPFTKGVKNPIYKMIRSIKGHEKMTVLEIGCGIGTLIPFLSKNFKHVVAIDISHKMIELAQERNARYTNVDYLKLDVVNINTLRKKFDVIVTVNSLLMPNIVKVNRAFSTIFRVLKRGGYLVGILPSFDALVYQAIITFDKEYQKRKDHKKAHRATSRIVASRYHDFCYGLLNKTTKNEKQKHYYGFEIEYRLRRAGFKRVIIGKVSYPWELIESEHNPKRFDSPLYDQLWDWTVLARKW